MASWSLQTDLNNILQWTWKMKLNMSKCWKSCTLEGTTQVSATSFWRTTNYASSRLLTLRKRNSLFSRDFLGVQVNYELNWGEHVANVCSKAIESLACFVELSSTTLWMFGKSSILPTSDLILSLQSERGALTT